MRLIIGLLLLTIATILLYFAGHKHIVFLNAMALVIILSGWIEIFNAVGFIKHIRKNGRNKIVKKSVETAKTIVAGVLTLIMADMIQIQWIKRVDRIIETHATNITTATIMDIDEFPKGITIEYDAEGKTIEQFLFIPQEGTDVYIGQKIKVKYAIEYPEMFHVNADDIK